MRGPPDAMLATRLRELKDHRGISCRQLGEAIGISNAAAFRYFSGSTHVPAELLPAMARAFNCSIGDMFMPPGAPLPKAVRRSARRPAFYDGPAAFRLRAAASKPRERFPE